jgi:hypothetical protein
VDKLSPRAIVAPGAGKMRKFIQDVQRSSSAAKLDAKRELAVTIGVALSAFFVGPVVFSLLAVPLSSTGDAFFAAFTGSDVYVAAVSLLSISIYSISKEYNVEGRDYFSFPHAVTILLTALLIVVIAFSVCTARVVYEAIKPYLTWRASVAGVLGWLTFFFTSAFAYGVLVLRNDMEKGSAHRTHEDEEDFVRAYHASQAEQAS